MRAIKKDGLLWGASMTSLAHSMLLDCLLFLLSLCLGQFVGFMVSLMLLWRL